MSDDPQAAAPDPTASAAPPVAQDSTADAPQPTAAQDPTANASSSPAPDPTASAAPEKGTSPNALTDAHYDWVQQFCGIDPRDYESQRNGTSESTDDGASSAISNGDMQSVSTNGDGTLQAAIGSGEDQTKDGFAGVVADAVSSIPVHVPSMESLKEDAKDAAMFGLGVVRGVTDAFTPLGAGGLLPSPAPGSKAFAVGEGLGQVVTGAAQGILGAGGEIGGVVLDATGIGAAVGVPVGAVSLAVAGQGVANVAVGTKNLTHAMSMGGDGSSPPSSSETPPVSPENEPMGPGHNAAEADRLKSDLASQHIENADRKGSGSLNDPDPGSGLKSDRDHRAAALISPEEIAKKGVVTPIKGKDGVRRTLVQVPDQEVNGRSGIVEYIIDADGSITHQRFIQDGVIGEGPNKKIEPKL
jgi:hypothetical protein